MMRRLPVVLLMFAAAVISVPAEEQRVFAPFVSRLSAEADDERALLSWKDAADIDGSYLVYRHDRPIDETTFPEAIRIGEVMPGVGSYIDTPPPGKEYFYAVIATDSAGNRYPVFVPFRNATRQGVVVREIPVAERAARVSGIAARVDGDAVELAFSPSRGDRSLIVFRSTSPIVSSRDVYESIVLTTVESSRNGFRDYPVPGISYYYAVLDSAMVEHQLADPEEGVNATVTAVMIPLQEERIGLPAPPPIRTINPLPFLRITSGLTSGQPLAGSIPTGAAVRQELSAEAAEAEKSFLAAIPDVRSNPMRLTILPQDRGEPSDGESMTLYYILRETLIPGDWDRADEYLRNFLSVPHSRSASDRARFYLGQTRYFREEYREAFMDFLQTEERYYTRTQPWLRASLDRLRKLED